MINQVRIVPEISLTVEKIFWQKLDFNLLLVFLLQMFQETKNSYLQMKSSNGN